MLGSVYTASGLSYRVTVVWGQYTWRGQVFFLLQPTMCVPRAPALCWERFVSFVRRHICVDRAFPFSSVHKRDNQTSTIWTYRYFLRSNTSRVRVRVRVRVSLLQRIERKRDNNDHGGIIQEKKKKKRMSPTAEYTLPLIFYCFDLKVGPVPAIVA